MNEFERRIEVLKAMHTIVKNMNDEYAYELWITEGMPDEPDESDFQDVAYEYFEETTAVFTNVIKRYGKNGY